MAKPKNPPTPPQAASRGGFRRFLRGLFITLGMLLVLGVVGGAATVAGVYFWISQDLPRLSRLADYQPPAVTQILAADGQLMAEFSRERRYVVPMEAVPDHVVKAFVAAEDGDFYKHQGVDIWGIIRAAIANFRAGRVVQGGSTITQQVARGILLSPQQTFTRKLKEMILAFRMERYLTKQEIMLLYLNQNYQGHGAYGVESAARTFFGKHVQELTVAESALLAGLMKAPNRYSPIRHPRRARSRQVYVIGRMEAEGFITHEQAQDALNERIVVQVHRANTVDAPYYTEAVRQELEARFGAGILYEGGLTVETACDPALTIQAQKSMADGLDALSKRQGYRGPQGRLDHAQLDAVVDKPLGPAEVAKGQTTQGVVVAVDDKKGTATVRIGAAVGYLHFKDLEWARPRPSDPLAWTRPPERIGQVVAPGDLVLVRLLEPLEKENHWNLELTQEPVAQSALLCLENQSGRVRVMVGGSDFDKSQFNRALQARRQPGSSFKPLIFAAALDHPDLGYNPSSVILDAPVVYDDPGQPGEKWKPKNYENRFYGPTTFRQALEHSRNVVTVKILSSIGLDYAVDYAKRFGIQSELSPNLSLALGTSGLSLLELTRAYGVFADGGMMVEPVMIERVRDRAGKIIYEAKPRQQKVIDPQTAFVMTYLLKGVIQNGTGQDMKSLGRPLAGKTGTTNDLRDAWFMGFSPQLTCGVWVGQDDNQPLGRRETGARAAGPIWKEFMGAALADQPAVDFPAPEGVVFKRVDPDTGQPLPPGDEGGFFEAYKAGTEPDTVQTASGGPANPIRRDTQDFLQAETFATTFPDPAQAPAPQ